MIKKDISTKWSANLAYAIGLIVTDGCLSKDKRHIDLTSKDREQLENFLMVLKLNNKISTKKSGTGKTSLRVQIGNVRFYNFLISIGLTSNKSKTLKDIMVPDKYFFDFLRGHFDGDGTFYSYIDSRWKNSKMYYLCFCSASIDHILWLRRKLAKLILIKGSLVKSSQNSAYQLRFAKKETNLLIGKLYYNKQVVCLTRKLKKIAMVCAGGEMVYTYA